MLWLKPDVLAFSVDQDMPRTHKSSENHFYLESWGFLSSSLTSAHTIYACTYAEAKYSHIQKIKTLL